MMKLQTIDGELLNEDEFNEYIFQIMIFAAEHKLFNYPRFFFNLGKKCEMTAEELAGFLRNVNDNMEK